MDWKKQLAIGWRATRPFAFPASVIPVLVGTATVWVHAGVPVHWVNCLLTLLGVMTIHAGANIFNDYYDFKKSVDRKGTFGSSGLLIENTMTPGQLFTEGIILYAIGSAIGIYLWLTIGTGILILGLIGVIGGYIYTGGPALKYRALGDICVFVLFGVLITVGSYYVQTGRFSWISFFFSIPLGLLIDAILHGNNLRDITSDSTVAVITLAGHLGVKGSQYFYLFLVAAAFASILVFILTDQLPWTGLLVFLSLPIALRNIRVVLQMESLPKEKFAGIDGMGAQLQMVFGILLTAGIALGKWV